MFCKTWCVNCLSITSVKYHKIFSKLKFYSLKPLVFFYFNKVSAGFIINNLKSF